MLMQILKVVATVLDWALWLSILGFVLLVGYCLAFKKNVQWKFRNFEFVINTKDQQADHQ
ncbi:conserved hypothetical protein [Caldicellulosiruptor hydrothermalis 108]|uniref:Uncharacterized protein n=1 Tax=Caldicellulosiruptor hydrothermalis (strain DSM 18901 / VKM B-2411 / 108) TaxID=632292 RepID=E4QC05_CALH1|nr:hypothetical protein [Caldicellulosiruptor hydrothermalis]ADQ06179.1 conserved hypothetical protein [Caldicellulosiruptor hydrothermalis 108]